MLALALGIVTFGVWLLRLVFSLKNLVASTTTNPALPMELPLVLALVLALGLLLACPLAMFLWLFLVLTI